MSTPSAKLAPLWVCLHLQGVTPHPAHPRQVTAAFWAPGQQHWLQPLPPHWLGRWGGRQRPAAAEAA
jgi:hypothetical protein